MQLPRLLLTLLAAFGTAGARRLCRLNRLPAKALWFSRGPQWRLPSGKVVAPPAMQKLPWCDHTEAGNLRFKALPKNMSQSMNKVMRMIRRRGKLRRGKVTNFAVIRDPIDRFISAYSYVCFKQKECGSEHGSVHQFASFAYEMLHNPLRTPRGVFNLHQIEDLRHHIAPQIWNCDLQNNVQRYTFVKYTPNTASSTRRQLRNVFRRAGVPKSSIKEAFAQLRKEKRNAGFKRSRALQLRRQILANRNTLGLLTAMYWDDFRVFRMPPPC